ncbi:MAG: MFS transporter [Proteobacteria bacterium]|nr:MFS transporter [Pseudomonadota bacterium]
MALFFRRISALRSGERAASGLYRIMLLMGLYLVVVQINRSGGAVMASELMSSRGYRPTEVGAIMGSMFLASAVVQLPAGVLYDRHGPRVMLSAMNLIAVIGLILFAFAASVPGLTLGRSLIGLGHGTVIAGIYLLAVAWVPVDRVATVTATVIGMAGGLGALLSTTPLALTLGQFGFTLTFAILAILTLTFSVAIFLMVRDQPDSRDPRHPRTVESIRQSLHGLWEVASDRDLLPIYIMGSCFTAPFLTIGGLWAGPYLRDVYALDNTQSSFVLLVMMLALYLGYMAYGPMDRIFNSRKWVVLGGVAGMLLCLLPLALVSELPLIVVVPLLVVFAFCSPFFVTLAAHCRGFVPVNRVGRAIACINLMGLVNVFVLQALAGVLVEGVTGTGAEATANGYRSVFAMVAVVLIVTGSVYTRVRDVPVRAAGDT